MSDLVKRLRDVNGGWASDEALAAADRIEELEERLKAATDDAKEAEDYAGELEAKLKWVEVDLRVINALDPEASMDGCSRYTLTTIVGLMGGKARDALAKLTGGKNE